MAEILLRKRLVKIIFDLKDKIFANSSSLVRRYFRNSTNDADPTASKDSRNRS